MFKLNIFTGVLCRFGGVFSTDYSCRFGGCSRQTPPSLRATSPNLGEEPSYRIGCFRHWDFH
ncbi:MAG: hypothetical protein LUD00_11960, partial [Prevotellaceae bacterium]|nr:hypothetical protein [Prevotellaceae bacterium]